LYGNKSGMGIFLLQFVSLRLKHLIADIKTGEYYLAVKNVSLRIT
jgi:hypothetical protein